VRQVEDHGPGAARAGARHAHAPHLDDKLARTSAPLRNSSAEWMFRGQLKEEGRPLAPDAFLDAMDEDLAPALHRRHRRVWQSPER